jgi:hypothetical protein
MRKLPVFAAIALLFVPLAATAPDVEIGKRCGWWYDPNSSAEVKNCVSTNQHDFYGWHEGLFRGNDPAESDCDRIYLYWVKLFRDGELADTNTFNTWFDCTGRVVKESSDWYQPCAGQHSYFGRAKFKIDYPSGYITGDITWDSYLIFLECN